MKNSAIKWNDSTLATNLYKVYLGSAADFKNKNIAADEKVPPASIRLANIYKTVLKNNLKF